MANQVDFEYRNAEEWKQESSEAPRPRVTRVLMRVSKSRDATPAGRAVAQLPVQLKRYTTHPKGVITAKKQHARFLKPRLPPRNVRFSKRLPGERDNAAKAAWRLRAPATGSFELPCRYDRLDASAFREGKQFRGKASSVSLDYVLEQIGYQSGAYIEPPSTFTNPFLKLWGTEDQLAAAKVALRGWIARSQEKRRANNRQGWEKFHAQPSARRQALQDKELKEMTRRRNFRRAPKDTEVFTAAGIFITPVKEFDAAAVLGNNLEAFDSIRADCSCHVIFDSQRSVLKVLSNDPSLVQQALHRIRVAFCEMASQNNKTRKLYVVDPPTSRVPKQEIGLVDRIPMLASAGAGEPLSGKDLETWESQRDGLTAANKQSQKRIALQTLEDLNFFRGHAHMRVHLGKMLLSRYKKSSGPRYTIDEFCTMLQLTPTQGELTTWLDTDDEFLRLISRCSAATDLFWPKDATTSSMETLTPPLSASFEFAGQESCQSIRLEVELQEVPGEPGYEIAAVRWLNGDNETRLDMINLNLDRGLAWQLKVETGIKIEDSKVTKAMRDFVQSLQVEVVEQHKNSTISFPKVKFMDLGVLKLTSFVQQTKFQYQMAGCDYIFEITRNEMLRSPSFASKLSNQVAEVTWGTSLLNTEWDRILHSQIELEVGTAGDWLPDIQTFFPLGWASLERPSGDAGFEEFLAKIETVLDIMTEENEAELIDMGV